MRERNGASVPVCNCEEGRNLAVLLNKTRRHNILSFDLDGTDAHIINGQNGVTTTSVNPDWTLSEKGNPDDQLHCPTTINPYGGKESIPMTVVYERSDDHMRAAVICENLRCPHRQEPPRKE